MIAETIYSHEDTLRMLDSLFRRDGQWWDQFYADRNKEIPFFEEHPDENLVRYFNDGLITPGKVLELGCGAGRNAIFLTQQGCSVDAVDLSQEAVKWGAERAESKAVEVNFVCGNMFDLSLESESCDLIYDSGCFHHILPHRRASFLDMLNRTLKPGGYFGLVCFAAGAMGAEISDWEVYRERSLKGGLGYTEEKLRAIFKDFEIIDFRRMRQMEPEDGLFGQAFLWNVLFRKN